MRVFWESVHLALQALWANKLRSMLTLVGVIIGVMTIIAMVSLINGMNTYVADRISSMGATTFIVDRYGIVTSEDQWWEIRKRKPITTEDMEAIDELCEECAVVSGRNVTSATVKRGNQYIDGVHIMGSTPNWIQTVDFEVERGRYVSEDDYQHRRRVAFIGYDVIDNLFPGIDPIGKTIKIDARKYTVIGHGNRRGSTLGMSNDNYIVIPMTSFEKQYGSRRSVDIFIKAQTFERMQEAKDEVRMILRARRNVGYHDDDNFGIMTASDFMSMWEDFSRMIFFVMIGISSISLVVGGVVVMNIMLVSVTERTREVGIRKAVGARSGNILLQFLLEAVMLSLIGGGLGVLGGFLLGSVGTSQLGVPAGIALWSVLLGLGVASTVGIFFGVYPAMKAARLDPIEALRYE